jgi:hypothetical protein
MVRLNSYRGDGMKKWGLFIILLIVLTGCRSTPFDGHSVIDWVDFIKWDCIEYDGIYSGVLADEKYIGEVNTINLPPNHLGLSIENNSPIFA